MKPYKALAEKMASNPFLIVAKINDGLNEVPGVKVDGVPTVLLYKKGAPLPIKFKKALTVDNLIEFLKKNMGDDFNGNDKVDL